MKGGVSGWFWGVKGTRSIYIVVLCVWVSTKLGLGGNGGDSNGGGVCI